MAYEKLTPRDLSFMKINAHEVRAVSATWAYYNNTSLGMSCRLPFEEQKRRLRLFILDPYNIRLETCIDWGICALLESAFQDDKRPNSKPIFELD